MSAECIFDHTPTRPLSDTATQSGLFCAIATTIDRCKTEGVVDVFQVVKALRVHKPGAVPSLVSQYMIPKGTFQTLTSILKLIPILNDMLRSMQSMFWVRSGKMMLDNVHNHCDSRRPTLAVHMRYCLYACSCL